MTFFMLPMCGTPFGAILDIKILLGAFNTLKTFWGQKTLKSFIPKISNLEHFTKLFIPGIRLEGTPFGGRL